MKVTSATTEVRILHQYWSTVRLQAETRTHLGILSELFLISPSVRTGKKTLHTVHEPVFL